MTYADFAYCEEVAWDSRKALSGLIRQGDPWDDELYVLAHDFGRIPGTHAGAAKDFHEAFVDGIRRVYELAADPDGPWNRGT